MGRDIDEPPDGDNVLRCSAFGLERTVTAIGKPQPACHLAGHENRDRAQGPVPVRLPDREVIYWKVTLTV
jgi:hypothetical protein